MARFVSGSGSDTDYSYDLTVSDEELLLAITDRLSPVSPQSKPAPPTPSTPVRRFNSNAPTPSTYAISSSPFMPLDPVATQAVDNTIAALSDDDLSFDISELQDDGSPSSGRGNLPSHGRPRGGFTYNHIGKLAPAVTRHDGDLASFVSKTKPRSMPTLLPGPDVVYPDRRYRTAACSSYASN